MDRTTYMFTYVDPQPGSPKLEELLEEYWELMQDYQVSSWVCYSIHTLHFHSFSCLS